MNVPRAPMPPDRRQLATARPDPAKTAALLEKARARELAVLSPRPHEVTNARPPAAAAPVRTAVSASAPSDKLIVSIDWTTIRLSGWKMSKPLQDRLLAMLPERYAIALVACRNDL